jgi:excisionase family DNA binding protein
MPGKNPRLAKAFKTGPATDPLAAEPARLTVSIETAAALLGVSRAAAYVYARNGQLPVIRLGTRLLVPKAALDKLLACA